MKKAIILLFILIGCEKPEYCWDCTLTRTGPGIEKINNYTACRFTVDEMKQFEADHTRIIDSVVYVTKCQIK